MSLEDAVGNEDTVVHGLFSFQRSVGQLDGRRTSRGNTETGAGQCRAGNRQSGSLEKTAAGRRVCGGHGNSFRLPAVYLRAGENGPHHDVVGWGAIEAFPALPTHQG